MSEQRQTTEISVPANEWQAYIDAFTETLGHGPNPPSPPVAVFQLPNGDELRVIRVDEIEETRSDQLPFIGVNSPEVVDLVFGLIPQKNHLREPYNIRVVGWQGKPVSTILRIATYKLFTHESLVAAEGGVIHNPPFG
jgi:hypothetical protein